MKLLSLRLQYPALRLIAIVDEIIIEQVISGKDWLLHAERGVRIVARRQEQLTSDDVWEWLNKLELKLEVYEPRAMGSVLRNAARDHIILPVNQWKVSQRAIAHQRPVRIWKSLIF